MSTTVLLSEFRKKAKKQRTFFTKPELRQLLDVYSRRVASGEWRDYAIDHYGPIAVFSVFRHSYDLPLFAIAKSANGKSSEYAVFSGKEKLKRASNMSDALEVFNKHPRLVHSR